MKYRCLIVLALVLTNFTVTAQSFLGVNEKAAEIGRSSPVITFSNPMLARIAPSKSNYMEMASIWMLWKSDNNYWIQKTAECVDSLGEKQYDTTYSPIQIINHQAYDFMTSHFDSLINENFKPGLAKIAWNGTDSIYALHQSHDKLADIQIFFRNVQYSKLILDSGLDDGMLMKDDGSLSQYLFTPVNCLFNIRTRLYHLYVLLNKLVTELEFPASNPVMH